MSEPSAGRGGRITVTRSAVDTMGVLLALPVTVDGRRVAALEVGGSTTLDVSAGPHEVHVGRSHPLAVDVAPGATVHVWATHLPAPSTWRLLAAPRRSTRPILTVIDAALPPVETDERAAVAALVRDSTRLVGGLSRALATTGALLLLAGVATAVLGRDDTGSLVLGTIAACLGFAALVGAVSVRRAARATADAGAPRETT